MLTACSVTTGDEKVDYTPLKTISFTSYIFDCQINQINVELYFLIYQYNLTITQSPFDNFFLSWRSCNQVKFLTVSDSLCVYVQYITVYKYGTYCFSAILYC